MNTFDRHQVKAILFDVYGTLAEIGDKRAPFRQLIQIGARQGRQPGSDDARTLMAQPLALDAYTWSFEAAAIKPDPAIYAQACRQLGCAPAEVLMVGDTVDADVEGPRAFGMQALLLDRKGRSRREDALASLSALCDLL